jgi:WhiB family transcriptional regulator, redox-sensing transcriptional regulator
MAAEERHWRSAAACRSCDPDLFFPVSSSGLSLRQVAEAKKICARCPVRPQCLAFAWRIRQVHGVWGGTSEQDRYLLWRRNEGRIDPGAGKGGLQRVHTDVSRVPESAAKAARRAAPGAAGRAS